MSDLRSRRKLYQNVSTNVDDTVVNEMLPPASDLHDKTLVYCEQVDGQPFKATLKQEKFAKYVANTLQTGLMKEQSVFLEELPLHSANSDRCWVFSCDRATATCVKSISWTFLRVNLHFLDSLAINNLVSYVWLHSDGQTRQAITDGEVEDFIELLTLDSGIKLTPTENCVKGSDIWTFEHNPEDGDKIPSTFQFTSTCCLTLHQDLWTKNFQNSMSLKSEAMSGLPAPPEKYSHTSIDPPTPPIALLSLNKVESVSVSLPADHQKVLDDTFFVLTKAENKFTDSLRSWNDLDNRSIKFAENLLQKLTSYFEYEDRKYSCKFMSIDNSADIVGTPLESMLRKTLLLRTEVSQLLSDLMLTVESEGHDSIRSCISSVTQEWDTLCKDADTCEMTLTNETLDGIQSLNLRDLDPLDRVFQELKSACNPLSLDSFWFHVKKAKINLNKNKLSGGEIEDPYYFLHECGSAWVKASNKWRKAIQTIRTNLSDALKRICFLNLAEIVRSITERMKEKESVTNIPQILFLIGKTGGGKTTTVHYLHQSRFEFQAHRNDHYEPIPLPDKVEQLQWTKSSRFDESMTSKIHITVAEDDSGSQLAVADTPGSEDTSGDVTDIVNSYFISSALRREHQHTRIAVVISNTTLGDRMKEEPVKEYFRSFANITSNLSNLNYIFTKTNATPEELSADFERNANSLITTSTDSVVKAVWLDIARKLKVTSIGLENRAFILSANELISLNKNQKAARDCLNHFSRVPPIDDSSSTEVIGDCVPRRARNSLSRELELVLSTVEKNIELCNEPFVAYYLDILDALQKTLPLQECSTYKHEVFDLFKRRYNKAREILQYLTQDIYLKNSIEISRLIHNLTLIRIFSELYLKLQPQSTYSLAEGLEWLETGIKNEKSRIQELTMKEFTSQIASNIKISLQTLKCLRSEMAESPRKDNFWINYVQDLDQYFAVDVPALILRFFTAKLIDRFVEHLSTHQLVDALNVLEKMLVCAQTFEEFVQLSGDGLLELYYSKRQEFVTTLEKLKERCMVSYETKFELLRVVPLIVKQIRSLQLKLQPPQSGKGMTSSAPGATVISRPQLKRSHSSSSASSAALARHIPDISIDEIVEQIENAVGLIFQDVESEAVQIVDLEQMTEAFVDHFRIARLLELVDLPFNEYPLELKAIKGETHVERPLQVKLDKIQADLKFKAFEIFQKISDDTSELVGGIKQCSRRVDVPPLTETLSVLKDNLDMAASPILLNTRRLVNCKYFSEALTDAVFKSCQQKLDRLEEKARSLTNDVVFLGNASVVARILTLIMALIHPLNTEATTELVEMKSSEGEIHEPIERDFHFLISSHIRNIEEVIGRFPTTLSSLKEYEASSENFNNYRTTYFHLCKCLEVRHALPVVDKRKTSDLWKTQTDLDQIRDNFVRQKGQHLQLLHEDIFKHIKAFLSDSVSAERIVNSASDVNAIVRYKNEFGMLLEYYRKIDSHYYKQFISRLDVLWVEFSQLLESDIRSIETFQQLEKVVEALKIVDYYMSIERKFAVLMDMASERKMELRDSLEDCLRKFDFAQAQQLYANGNDKSKHKKALVRLNELSEQCGNVLKNCSEVTQYNSIKDFLKKTCLLNSGLYFMFKDGRLKEREIESLHRQYFGLNEYSENLDCTTLMDIVQSVFERIQRKVKAGHFKSAISDICQLADCRCYFNAQNGFIAAKDKGFQCLFCSSTNALPVELKESLQCSLCKRIVAIRTGTEIERSLAEFDYELGKTVDKAVALIAYSLAQVLPIMNTCLDENSVEEMRGDDSSDDGIIMDSRSELSNGTGLFTSKYFWIKQAIRDLHAIFQEGNLDHSWDELKGLFEELRKNVNKIFENYLKGFDPWISNYDPSSPIPFKGRNLTSQVATYEKMLKCFNRCYSILPSRFVGEEIRAKKRSLDSSLDKASVFLERRKSTIAKLDSPRQLLELWSEDQADECLRFQLEKYFESFLQKLKPLDLLLSIGSRDDADGKKQELLVALHAFAEEGDVWFRYTADPRNSYSGSDNQLQTAAIDVFRRLNEIFRGNEYTTIINRPAAQQFYKTNHSLIIATARCQKLTEKSDATISLTIKKALNYLTTELNYFYNAIKEFSSLLASIETSLPAIDQTGGTITLTLQTMDANKVGKLEKIRTEFKQMEDLVRDLKVFENTKSFDKDTNELLDSIPWSEFDEVKERIAKIEENCSFVVEHMMEHYESYTKTPNRADKIQFFSMLNFSYLMVKRFVMEDFTRGQFQERMETIILRYFERCEKILSEMPIASRVPISVVVKLSFEELNKSIDNLFCVVETFTEFQVITRDKLRLVEDHFKTKRDEISTTAWLDENDWAHWTKELPRIGDQLILMMTLAVSIPRYAEDIKAHIAYIMAQYQNRDDTNRIVGHIGIYLENSSSDGIGQKILVDVPLFNGYKSKIRNLQFERVKPMDIIGAIQTLSPTHPRLSQAAQDRLSALYEAHYELYWKTIDSYLAPQNRKKIQKDFPGFISKEASEARKSKDGNKTVDHIVNIISYCFAFWTLHDLKGYDATGAQSRNYLTQPHPGQVIVLFRLLGLDSDEFATQHTFSVISFIGNILGLNATNIDCSFTLKNRVAEIKTGQGKSIVLAILATVLALMNFRVDIACYSDYLTSRDKKVFQFLFKAVNVESQIEYETFKTLCERLLHGKMLRDHLADTIRGKANPHVGNSMNPNQSMPSILLIDEVDVLLSSNFYGKRYQLLSLIKSKDCPLPSDPNVFPIADLVRFIWSLRNDRDRVGAEFAPHRIAQIIYGADDEPFKHYSQTLWDRVVESTPYKNCLKLFHSMWSDLIENTARKMLSDVKDLTSEKYEVTPGKGIGYFDHDLQRVYNKRIGYKTLFVFLLENERDPTVITDQMVEDEMGILVQAGTLSYAELSKFYNCTMGVTGTLQTLTEGELSLLQTGFDIHKENCTILPSAYPESDYRKKDQTFRGAFGVDIKYGEDTLAYYEKIVEEIRSYTSEGRPVLVFFSNDTNLDNFAKSGSFSEFSATALKLNSFTDAVDRDGIIDKAVEAGRVTLVIAAFGRGTDFNYHNKALDDQGGIHVIQAFFSLDTSEEIQIRGRTRRQGHPGSYSMVLQKSDFQTMDDPGKVQHRFVIYTGLVQSREDLNRIRFEDRKQLATLVRREHDASQEMLIELFKGNLTNVQRYIDACNHIDFFRVVARTIILIDGTGSMTELLGKCKTTIKNAVTRLTDFLNLRKLEYGYEIQLVVYRNYNSHDLLLEASSFYSDPGSLFDFLERVTVSGGMGNEAVEIGLQHVNSMLKAEKDRNVSYQVILIGDYPPNTKNEVTSRRGNASARGLTGEAYWRQNSAYPKPTFYKDEIGPKSEILKRNVKVFPFYLKAWNNGFPAKDAFDEIARATRGRDATAQELKIGSEKGEEDLMTLISTKVMQNIQTRVKDGSVDLVQAFLQYNNLDTGFL